MPGMIMNISNMDLLLTRFLKKSDSYNDIYQKLQNEFGDDLFHKIEGNVKKIIFSIIAESVIAEFSSYKANESNTNKSMNIVRLQFVGEINTRAFFDYFSKKYIVLNKLVDIAIKDYLSEIKAIIEHYYDDQNVINITFDKEFGKVIDILSTSGDIHDGKSVKIIICEGGKIVYKPREMLQDQLFGNIIQIISDHYSIDMKTPKLLICKNYSWQEYVESRDFTTLEEVNTFYWKCGIYLSVFLLCGSSDMHYENMIANRSDPIFIDLETLLRAEVNSESALQCYRDIRSSVLYTSLLPIVDEKNGFDINFSALFIGKNKSDKMNNYHIVEDENKGYIYINKPVEIIKHNLGNQYYGKTIMPADVMDYLLNGFDQGCSFIINNKKSIIRILNDPQYDHMKIRIILRATQIYSTFLSASHIPSVLQSYVQYDKVFKILQDAFTASKYGYSRVNAEVQALKRGYIPYFYTEYNSKDLCHDSFAVCNDYLYSSPKVTIMNKLCCFTKDYIEYQKYLITLSLSCVYDLSDFLKKDNYKTSCSNNNGSLSTVLRYLQSIEKYFIYSDKSFISMPLLETRANSLAVSLLNPGIYNGGGILALLMFSSIIDAKYLSISGQCLDYLYRQYEMLRLNKETTFDYGVFSGLGGLVYLSHNFYKLTGQRKYENNAIRIINDAIDYYENQNENADLSYISGVGGLLQILNNITCFDSKKEIQERLLRIVINNIDGLANYPDGFLHGKIGILTPSIMTSHLLDDKESEMRLLDNYDKTIISSSLYTNNHWCSGKLGLLCSLSIINSVNYTQRRYEIINEITSDCISQSYACICHGVASLIDCSKYKKIEPIFSDLNIQVPVLLDYDSIIWDNYNFNNLHSFMLGMSGYVYSILSQQIHDVPSILMLDEYNKSD